MTHLKKVIAELQALSDAKVREGMARWAANSETALGVSIPALRKIAKLYKKDHALALALWETNIHEARILAGMIGDPEKVTKALMEKWVKDFNSWDICDQVCGNLFDRTPHAFAKAIEWTARKKEYEKRAGFVMMAELAVHNKEALDSDFIPFFTYIEAGASDERNFVVKPS